MIDFELNTQNMLRRDSVSIKTTGEKHPIMTGRDFKIEYMLHKDDFPDPHNPAEALTMYCLYVPQINMSYTDRTEEAVFEALEECFEEDFVLYLATKLNEKRQENKDE